ncbi:hypothetical protein [Polaribacter butkevichii]|uniref:Uncharacterized protein n=1 Tax=Polaribacter butkevichii TaxID=218490 RepID=A0A2P6CCX4_9FLAO|nr:hypothetical protein [Polaribacter butkevichii]PQJ72749.1 hypothetical protein BTO14_05520 [Polaribacter butkevichii]
MKTILNYQQSDHFEERIAQRQIDPFLVSMCLIKGTIKTMKRNKIEYTLTKESIKQAIEQGYIFARDYLGLISLTVVARENILITAFVKFGDTGITS